MKKVVLLLASIIQFTLFASPVSAAKIDDFTMLEVLANKNITMKTSRMKDNGTQIAYEGLQDFVVAAREETTIADEAIGGFLLDYTSNPDSIDTLSDFSSEQKLKALKYEGATVSSTYFRVGADDDGNEISKEEYLSIRGIVMDDWWSSDGYIWMATSAYDLGTVSGGHREFDVIVIQEWAKKPVWFLEDAIAISTNKGTFKTGTEWAQNSIRTECLDRTCINAGKNQISGYWVLDNKSKPPYGKFVYPGPSGFGMLYHLQSMAHGSGERDHLMGKWLSEIRMGCTMIVDKNTTANFQAAYSHKKISISSSIGISFSGSSISFSLSGSKSDYKARSIYVTN